MLKDFYESYIYLDEHPIFRHKELGYSSFRHCIDIQVVKVNPKTLLIDDIHELNTKTQVWLECGPYIGKDKAHDYDLDCGGDTFEEAIIELARLVKCKYTDNIEYALSVVKEQYGDTI